MAPPKKHRARTILIAVASVVVLVAVVAGGYVFTLANTFDGKTETLQSAFPDEEGRPVKDPGDASMNILLMGADFGGANQVTSNVIESGGTGQRSDTMMLVHIPANREGVYVMSVMRDTWLEIPGHGMNKINAAMAFGGVPLVVQTFEGLFDTKIDHVAVIDFQGFRDLTTALGGVTVQNDIAFTANDTDYFYPVGELNLKGDRALRFVRERKSFVSGDYQRVKNQQKFLDAVINKMLAAQTLTNPATLYQVIDKVSPYLTLDKTFDAQTIAGLGLQLKDLRPNDVHSFTLPTAGTSRSADGQSIVLKDQEAIDRVGRALRSDTMKSYLSEESEAGSATSSGVAPGTP
ncbi:LCP family protein [Arthrobacter sp. JSM 101049]|uniref:LCP family protein n=1 Tax=Arthrobacter sp. JSM 101049 TaxID=929097 RepID=UPI00356A61FE